MLFRPTQELTAAEIFEISQRVASLPGRWSAINQCTDDGISYVGLSDLDADDRVAVMIARDRDGLFVTRVSGEVVARGCVGITAALAAVQWMLRHR